MDTLCFPFNCAGVNTGTSTNGDQCKRAREAPLESSAPAGRDMATIEELAERVERLLLRHQELQRTHALALQQHAVVVAERDSLRSRLAAARQRVDALLDRLPATEKPLPATGPDDDTKASA